MLPSFSWFCGWDTKAKDELCQLQRPSTASVSGPKDHEKEGNMDIPKESLFIT